MRAMPSPRRQHDAGLANLELLLVVLDLLADDVADLRRADLHASFSLGRRLARPSAMVLLMRASCVRTLPS